MRIPRHPIMQTTDMIAAALCSVAPPSPAAETEFVPSSVTPPSPDPEHSSALAEPPAVPPKKVVVMPAAQRGKRCLVTAFGDSAWTHQSSDDEEMGAFALPPMSLKEGDEAMEAGAEQDKGKGAPPAVQRPRLWMRGKKKACIVKREGEGEGKESNEGEGSSQFMPVGAAEVDLDIEARKLDLDMEHPLCVLEGAEEPHIPAAEAETRASPAPASSRMPALANVQRTPPHSLACKDIEFNLSPLKQLRLFDRFELFDEE